MRAATAVLLTSASQLTLERREAAWAAAKEAAVLAVLRLLSAGFGLDSEVVEALATQGKSPSPHKGFPEQRCLRLRPEQQDVEAFATQGKVLSPFLASPNGLSGRYVRLRPGH